MPHDLITKPITDVAEPAAKAIGNSLAEVWKGIVGDRITAWRIKKAATLDEKLHKALGEANVELSIANLPEGMAFRWFQRATEADEPEIQELFAKLLANAANGNHDALFKRNIDLVSNLTPEDARLLSFIHERYCKFQGTRLARYDSFEITYDWSFEREFKEAGFLGTLSIDALLSFGILRLERNFKSSGDDIGSVLSVAMSGRVQGANINLGHMFEEEEKLVLTEVGKSLLQALFPSTVHGASVKQAD